MRVCRSQSARSLSGLLVAVAVAFVVLQRAQTVGGAAAGTLLVSICLLFLTFLLLGVTFADDLMVLLGRDATLSGRTLLWNQLIELIEQRPLLGYGYGAIWRTSAPYVQTLSTVIGWTPEHAHNGYLDLLLALGMSGIGVLAVLLLKAIAPLSALLRVGDAPAVYFSVSVLTFSLVYSLAESQILAEGRLLSVLFIVTLAALSRPHAAGAARNANDQPFRSSEIHSMRPAAIGSKC